MNAVNKRINAYFIIFVSDVVSKTFLKRTSKKMKDQIKSFVTLNVL